MATDFEFAIGLAFYGSWDARCGLGPNNNAVYVGVNIFKPNLGLGRSKE
jgi:hypothetical protein